MNNSLCLETSIFFFFNKRGTNNSNSINIEKTREKRNKKRQRASPVRKCNRKAEPTDIIMVRLWGKEGKPEVHRQHITGYFYLLSNFKIKWG